MESTNKEILGQPIKEVKLSSEDLTKILDSVPCLTAEGLGIDYDHQETSIQRRQRFRAARQSLIADLPVINKVCVWLTQNTRLLKGVRRRAPSSYGWKHRVENRIETYVSNGVLITAAIAIGAKYSPIDHHGLNVWLNLKMVPVKAEDRRRLPRSNWRLENKDE